MRLLAQGLSHVQGFCTAIAKLPCNSKPVRKTSDVSFQEKNDDEKAAGLTG